MTKYIFITGGVVSSLGKGIVGASLGKLLVARGYKVSMLKLDPYINVDPGTMNPFQHGEVFVTDDGAETDLDLGHYERFTDTMAGKLNNATAGNVYHRVIEEERVGHYLGGTVQVIPHITNEIKRRITLLQQATNPDFEIVEIGGTVGDIESLPFIEAIRQFKIEAGLQNAISIHVTLLPYLPTSGELKTKPSQHSVYTLRSYGIQPEMVVCRTQVPLGADERDKIALFCSVPKECVIECKDMKTIYDVPMALEEQGMTKIVLDLLKMENKTPDMSSWINQVNKMKNAKEELTVALAGKYTSLCDAYISVVESLKHAGGEFGYKIKLKMLATEECISMEDVKEKMQGVDALVVPGGFGVRGIEGKLNTIRYARENNIPFLGLCLGLQCAVIEFARNVCGLEGANSVEFDKDSPYKVVDLMLEQKDIAGYGGTMRLGSYPCHLIEGTKAKEIYNNNETIYERHRHRYEVNNDYIETLTKNGLIISGTSPNGHLVEMVEYPKNDYHIACQFHPEFKSRPTEPHPLFMGLIKAAISQKKKAKELCK